MLKGHFGGAEVFVNFFFERRNGWMRDLDEDQFKGKKDNIIKGLAMICPPFIKCLFMEISKPKIIIDDNISEADLSNAQEVYLEVDRIEVKVFYKER